ncbi:Gfo/Idh/MocA family protein [Dermatophilus congolensis]|uniref:Inositol 2-dehydrogenase n=1 Tax=Dermatophilus congolensis TaxID=1863 RepID=A0AA46BNG3_9MICO|nr:Gfo/Idh/MocA family oxidoreductase [Dermatophilus congolensis]MBO3143058.1 Gfo/Idh/MocA family oxidoreductase [Dermatophilus congolensis]MBO3152047.1 Gfo/Idh/MocA family oxidoreductase [Dermatophilus congolensis]MBO3160941.1 Gfo/Idh/MocA family oxidoreductase [Dermatophilus congolensis]MBO3163333.1 Gfo/Idh/MocA family oxidoreductase [Dermatophilus congolensis]MBO3176886.1 Gfo/Idh/MocA family oxidoreductase [Dermatophilus congolensis]
MANLRAGLIGLGMMGRHHGRVLAGLDGVDLVAVADPNGDPHDIAQGRPLVNSIEELLAHNLDYCMVAVPTVYHLEIGLALAEAGVHALIEKPLAQDTSSAQKLVDAFDKAGLIGATGHIERYNPALQQAKARIEAGDLGDVYQIVTRRQGPFPARIADVGVVKDLGTHDIDLTSWLRSSAYTSVGARTAFRSGREYEDMVLMNGLLADGTITQHTVNWLSPFKERITFITGEKGAFIADTLTAELAFHANGNVTSEWQGLAQFKGVSEGDYTRFAISKREPLLVEHENFRDAVLGKDSDIVTLEQGMRNVKVAEAAIESAKTGQTIDL